MGQELLYAGIVVHGSRLTVIDKKLLDELSAQAKASLHLRMALDLRNILADHCQRMLNALESETVMPIHRHHALSKMVVILRGKIERGSMMITVKKQKGLSFVRVVSLVCSLRKGIGVTR